ncbi:ABC transporter permease [Burkholderia pseudomultivorans]|uniref:Chain length determinant family protein n=1 Tax=Burkholderia cenocepacia TaxID=95486 RepID=A0AAN0RR57_9BURK|nr:ABC transporter permease [Burkholderia pseudomultivorans]AIO32218.1 chain length determinant family protein [Burkholderia cenocepacia]KWF11267.1 ABC transporter permease [Burkholderia pseudomultivorans]
MIVDRIKKNRLFVGIVIAPMILAAVYYIFLARDRYVSTSEVVVHKVGSDNAADASQIPGLAALMGGGGLSGGNSAETLYVREFVLSQDMLNVLQKKLQWSEHYAGQIRDPWYYLSPRATREELLKYYQKMVKAQYDATTGLLEISVQAFDRKFADQAVSVIISESDRFVNEISHRLAREQVSFSEVELERARLNYEEKREALLHFQGANNVLDAKRSALAHNEMITDLQTDLTKAEATLRAMRGSLSEDSPQIRQQKIQIQAIQQQISVENQKLISRNAEGQLNVMASKYQSLELNAGIAEDAYKASISALQNARIEATKKLRSLVVVVSPNVPDEALFPRRGYSLLTVLIILLLLYGITKFVIATINDHLD